MMKARFAPPSVTSDEGKSWDTHTKVQGSRKTQHQGILRHDRLAVRLLSESLVIKAMADAGLRDLITTEVTPTAIFPKFLCHTKAVERHMKLVTGAAKAVCGQNSRDGFIRARTAYRHLIPTFESKRHFYNLIHHVIVVTLKTRHTVIIKALD